MPAQLRHANFPGIGGGPLIARSETLPWPERWVIEPRCGSQPYKNHSSSQASFFRKHALPLGLRPIEPRHVHHLFIQNRRLVAAANRTGHAFDEQANYLEPTG